MADGVPYTIHGVKVVFPCKAYPTQLSMMDKIMKGLERRQHCLLESPTGSGKSLALLCSCLAWQKAEYEKEKASKQVKNSNADSPCCNNTKPSPSQIKPVLSPPAAPVIDLTSPKKSTTPVKPPNKPIDVEKHEHSEEEGDFRSDSKRFRTPIASKSFSAGIDTNFSESKLNNTITSSPVNPPEWKMEVTKNETPPVTSPCDSDGKKKSQDMIKVPKIYFGTRTHKQVSQIARELGKTAYKETRMCILSSREHTCIHPIVSKNSNKNEECRKLLDPSIKGETCIYFQKNYSVMASQAGIKSQGLVTAWDIEDFVRVGKKNRTCPYYSARELMREADIIFCPYNYLIDPKIRSQMDIDLSDQIVILDEAHNVEDSARESASISIDTLELQELQDDMDKMIQWGVMTTNYQSLHVMCASIRRWIDQCSDGRMQDRGFEQAVLVLTGDGIFTGLRDAGLTSASCAMYKELFSDIMANDKNPDNDYKKTSPTSRSVTVLEGLFLVLGYLFACDGKFLSDYRVAILKTAVFVRNQMAGAWKRAGIGMRKEWKYSLNIWCLNPAVVFSQLGQEARSIILTSGTLSPMSSFASELGVPFPIKLEANHVIANSQVWVGSLAVGPSNSPVNATFRCAETFSFQDDIGYIVLDVCQKIPHGVLCFFPSYNMLEKVSKRWQSTGLWSKLLQKKVVLSEPRSGDKSDFDDVMHEFYQAIRRSEGEENLDCSDSDDDDVCYASEGALFLAVCRGKVSEGLDFADNNARAVITVGIPFPNTKDLKIDLKRKYNDSFASKRGLLNGSEWYEIQAFRALNQALGRCIRHKQDWGAILLVDERFSKFKRYSNGISKWLRQRLYHFNNFNQAVNSLKEFADARQLVPCPSTQSTPRPVAAWGGDGFFVDSTPTKNDISQATNVGTPLTTNINVSTKADSTFNQSTSSSHVTLTNRFAANAMTSTPTTRNTSTNGSSLNESTRSVLASLPITPSIQNNIASTNHVTLLQPMASTLGVNTVNNHLNQQGVPVATGMAQAPPRLVFIPNNVVTRTPTSTTPTTAGSTQQVLYLTPVRLANQASNPLNISINQTPSNPLNSSINQTPSNLLSHSANQMPNSTTKVIVFNSPSNRPAQVNTPHNDVINHVPSAVPKTESQNSSAKCAGIIGSNNLSQGNEGFVYPTGQGCPSMAQPGHRVTQNAVENKNDLSNKESKYNNSTINGNTKDCDDSYNGISGNCGSIDGKSSSIEEQEKTNMTEDQNQAQPITRLNEVDMLDIECPNSPLLFSTPPSEDTHQSCDKDNDETQNVHKQVSSSSVENDVQRRAETNICTYFKTKAKDTASKHSFEAKVDESMLNKLKYETEADETTSENTKSSKKMCIDPSSAEIVSLTEQTASTKKLAQTNLRRTTRRTNKGSTVNKQVNVKEEADSKDNGVTKTISCNGCSDVLFEGNLTQQTVCCQELASMYNKFHTPKSRPNKKRKRGDSGAVSQAVWIANEVHCIPDTVKPLPKQEGAVFNALYKEDMVYIPLVCCQCHGLPKKDTSVLGVQVLLLSSTSPSTKQMWFFNDSVH